MIHIVKKADIVIAQQKLEIIKRNARRKKEMKQENKVFAVYV